MDALLTTDYGDFRWIKGFAAAGRAFVEELPTAPMIF
jgi:hypothetical protein